MGFFGPGNSNLVISGNGRTTQVEVDVVHVINCRVYGGYMI